MVLPLAIIMVVLIGVMGAGLLTFASTDLNTVIEVNQGQKAFDTAGSGIQAARRQLLSDAIPEHYGYGADPTKNVSWSYETTGGAVKAYAQMKTLSFDGKTIRISIQYLPPVTAPATPNTDQAPEIIPAGQTKLESGCNYFKVRSYGESGQAKRGSEAIYCASKFDVPTTYYTPKSIEFKGTVDVKGVSFFAGQDILQNGSVSFNRCTTPTELLDTANCPALYGDWDSTQFNPASNHNTQGRKTSYPSGTPIAGAGLAAERFVCNGGSLPCTDSDADGINDYDSMTSPKFCRKPAPLGSTAPCSMAVTVNDLNPSNTISYPFSPDFDPNLEQLEEEAKIQGNHYDTRKNIDTSNSTTKVKYPKCSTDQTVFYMDGQAGTVDYNIPSGYNSCAEPNIGPIPRGTIVIENGNFKMNGSVAFKGIVIVTGNGTTTGLYQTAGNPDLDGFVLADGQMTIRGDVSPITITDDWTNRPGFYGVKLWSWRELYK